MLAGGPSPHKDKSDRSIGRSFNWSFCLQTKGRIRSRCGGPKEEGSIRTSGEL